MVDLPNIMIIGLTGQSGAGKSTVCRVFAENGFLVIDCDAIARKTAEDPRFLEEISRRFTDELITPEGALNRKAVAKLIFTDSEKRERYQRIIFPYIVNEIMREITCGGDVLIDAPTLFEAKLDMLCDKIVSVTANLDKCAERIIKRDKMLPEQAYERLSSQHSAEFFKQRSDYNIENNGTLEELISSAKQITEKLKAGADNDKKQT